MSWHQQKQHQQQHGGGKGPPHLSTLKIGENIATPAMSSTMEGGESSQRRQMGPPSQTLPSLNFRQLAPLRSPNLPSYTHSSNYFSSKRNRSTSESVANDALRSLQSSQTLPPHLPEPPNRIQSSADRGEALPPLAAFISPLSPGASYRAYRSMKPSSSTSAISYQHSHQITSPTQTSPSIAYSQYSSSYKSPSSSPQVGHYSASISSRSQGSLSTSLQDTRFFSPTSPSSHQTFEHGGVDRSRESSDATMDRGDDNSPRKIAKSHVPSACLNCKRAHLACDVSRPCRRCINLGKVDTCIDVQHKKRGRPRLRDREALAAGGIVPPSVEAGRRKETQDFQQQPHYYHHPQHEHQQPVNVDQQYQMRGSISSTSSSASAMKESPRSAVEMTSYFPNQFAAGHGQNTSSYRPTLAHSHSYSSIMRSEGRDRSASSSSFLRPREISSSGAAPGDITIREDVPPTVSLILSTDLQCARCSEEAYALLGIPPSDLIERSLADLVHPSERDRLESLWISLIEPIGIRPQPIPASIKTIMSLSPAILMTPAPGTVYMQESMRLRRRSGIYDFYSIRLHLGGGLGTDLYQPSTFDRAYIVASLLKLGNDATHPDPNVLREGKWHLESDPRTFTTPQFRRSSEATRGSGISSTLPPIPPPPSAPPSYHSTSTSNEESSRRGSLSSEAMRARSEWDSRQGHQVESSPYLPAPPVYSRTASQSTPVQHSHQHHHHPRRDEIAEKQPRSAHDVHSSAKVSLHTARPSSQMITSGGTSESHSGNTGRVTAIPFSYSAARSESGGIIC